MITRIEYDQIALEAAAPDGLEPVTLSPDEMRSKLAELGIATSSPLHRHCLGGGRLWTRDGHAYQVATAAAGSVAANAASTEPSGEEGTTLLDRAADAWCGPVRLGFK